MNDNELDDNERMDDNERQSYVCQDKTIICMTEKVRFMYTDITV